MFDDAGNDVFTLADGSPAVGSGYAVENPVLDYTGSSFLNPRSIGAYEGGMVSGSTDRVNNSPSGMKVWPNPANHFIQIDMGHFKTEKVTVTLQSLTGQTLVEKTYHPDRYSDPFVLEPGSIPNGIYFLFILQGGFTYTEKIIIEQ